VPNFDHLISYILYLLIVGTIQGTMLILKVQKI
jgi:hypothetical protein